MHFWIRFPSLGSTTVDPQQHVLRAHIYRAHMASCEQLCLEAGLSTSQLCHSQQATLEETIVTTGVRDASTGHQQVREV